MADQQGNGGEPYEAETTVGRDGYRRKVRMSEKAYIERQETNRVFARELGKAVGGGGDPLTRAAISIAGAVADAIGGADRKHIDR
ncbi:hypothetical protein V5P93_007351 [Actinokineospora auranticolor]|uniref:Uncharacterized protein n=1 Tax=Actinokineospora auranticolor TaxID=155976 RepID=A0A2S6GS58_9PSEU|nr:hypothetical protein [Actinokineospora auranticolor]PPK68003.1 hypothetical protein CLV40_106236 [Actinokineospora auranticolor]